MSSECETHAAAQYSTGWNRLTGPSVRHASADADEDGASLDPVSWSVELYNRWPGEEHLAMSHQVDSAHGDVPWEVVRWAM